MKAVAKKTSREHQRAGDVETEQVVQVGRVCARTTAAVYAEEASRSLGKKAMASPSYCGPDRAAGDL